MKPISYVYSYINIPKNEWNDLDVDIWLYNAMKSLKIALKQQNTKMVNIVDNEACICEEYERLQAVVVRENVKDIKDLTDYPVVDGSYIVPAADYPIVQQTLDDQIYAIYPLLPYYFPNNDKRIDDTWYWAKARKVIFEKQCENCPTYCNDCEYVYDMKLDGCLYFPQIKEGVACINYLTYPKLEEYMIDDNNQALIDALAAYCMMNYYEIQLQMDFTQANKYLYETFTNKWIGFKKHAQISDMLLSLNIVKIQNIMNNKMSKSLRASRK